MIRKLLSALLIGRRVILYRSGHTNSGRDGHVSIGVVVGVNGGSHEEPLRVEVRSYGYDLSAEDYARDSFTWGEFTLVEAVQILLAQPLLRKQFRHVDTSREEADFYQSAAIIRAYQ